MNKWLNAVVLASFLAFSAFAWADESTDREIDHLLETVAGSGCIFIRNGKEHGAEAARDHLALKRRKGKRYYSNTEEFIDRLASSSSWSGKPYRIRCGADEVLAATWFIDTLTAYRAEPR